MSLEQVIRDSPVKVVPGRFAIVKVPEVPTSGLHFMVTYDETETTVITEEQQIAGLNVQAVEKWFTLIEFCVSVPFSAVGFLATIAKGVADAGMNILIVSTFSKDYILVRENDVKAALDVLSSIGFRTQPTSPVS